MVAAMITGELANTERLSIDFFLQKAKILYNCSKLWRKSWYIHHRNCQKQSFLVLVFWQRSKESTDKSQTRKQRKLSDSAFWKRVWMESRNFFDCQVCVFLISENNSDAIDSLRLCCVWFMKNNKLQVIALE